MMSRPSLGQIVWRKTPSTWFVHKCNETRFICDKQTHMKEQMSSNENQKKPLYCTHADTCTRRHTHSGWTKTMRQQKQSTRVVTLCPLGPLFRLYFYVFFICKEVLPGDPEMVQSGVNFTENGFLSDRGCSQPIFHGWSKQESLEQGNGDRCSERFKVPQQTIVHIYLVGPIAEPPVASNQSGFIRTKIKLRYFYSITLFISNISFCKIFHLFTDSVQLHSFIHHWFLLQPCIITFSWLEFKHL